MIMKPAGTQPSAKEALAVAMRLLWYAALKTYLLKVRPILRDLWRIATFDRLGGILLFSLCLWMINDVKQSAVKAIPAVVVNHDVVVPEKGGVLVTDIPAASETAPSIEIQEYNAVSYIKRFGPTAVAEMQKYGVPASISLAQGLVESRAGTSKLAIGNNNHFGIKCFSRRCPKGHCTNATDDTHKDFFRKFATPWESWRAHSKMISTGRYARLKKYGRDYRKWAYGLKSLGYATDRAYAQKLIGIIERYHLDQYDSR